MLDDLDWVADLRLAWFCTWAGLSGILGFHVTHYSNNPSTFLGIAVALMALELGVTFMILALPDDGTVPPLSIAWFLAPLLALPVLFTAGPLSGIGLVFVDRIAGRCSPP